MAYPPITPLPTPPSRADSPSTFATDADAFVAALPDLATDANALGAWMEATAADVDADAITASAAAAAAVAASGAAKWVTGTTYAQGDVRWSPIDYKSYRRKTAGAGSTDPSADSTNWALLAGQGDVSLTGTQTLTNKTLTSPALTSPAVTDPIITGAIREDVYTITDAAGFAIDPRNGSIQEITLGASRTPVAANFNAGESVTLKIADGTAYSITWTTIGVVWIGGVAPTLATTGWTWVMLWKVGSAIYGTLAGESA